MSQNEDQLSQSTKSGDGYATVYGLCDPKTMQVKYVGVTQKPELRLRTHISQSARNKAKSRSLLPSQKWINGLTDKGLKPVMIVLGIAPVAQAKQIEEEWIALLRKTTELCNVSPGGYRETMNPRLSLMVEPSATVKLFKGTQSGYENPDDIYQDTQLMIWFLNQIIDDSNDIEVLDRIALLCRRKAGLPDDFDNLDALQSALTSVALQRNQAKSDIDVVKEVAHDIAELRRKYAGE